MNKDQILTEINWIMDDFINVLSSFEDEQINVIPFDGSWTPGQVAQHIILSVSGFADLMAGPDQETDRQPDAYVANIRAIFLNFDIKMQSPDFILPPAIDYNKAELLAKLADIKAQLNQAIPAKDLNKTCITFELPVLGYLTRVELDNFIMVHTQRHIHQLKNIYNTINHKNLTT